MKKNRLNRIIAKMKNEGINELIISDPYSIYYITEKWIFPGERLLALYINTDGDVKLIVNELFSQKEDKDIDIVYYNDIEDGVEKLGKFLTASKIVGVDKKWPAKFLLRLQEIYPDKRYVNGSYIVDKIRQIKDEDEKNLMRKSSLINDEVMKELITYVDKGMTEIELGNIVKEIYAKNGIHDLSFDPITAYGKNGANPHHDSDYSLGKVGDSVVLDIGGIYKGYCSDMTRTVFIGEVSEKQREVYEIVKNANLRAISLAKAGNKMKDVDLAARNYIEEMGYGKYFTHRTGHSIGLEDHETGDVSSVNEEIIEVGQVFSIEPGIYLPEENFGVRIEDLVLITEDGCEVLNKLSKELMVIKSDK